MFVSSLSWAEVQGQNPRAKQIRLYKAPTGVPAGVITLSAYDEANQDLNAVWANFNIQGDFRSNLSIGQSFHIETFVIWWKLPYSNWQSGGNISFSGGWDSTSFQAATYVGGSHNFEELLGPEDLEVRICRVQVSSGSTLLEPAHEDPCPDPVITSIAPVRN